MKAFLLLFISALAIAFPDWTGHSPVLSIEADLRFTQDPSDPARAAFDDFKWSQGISADSTSNTSPAVHRNGVPDASIPHFDHENLAVGEPASPHTTQSLELEPLWLSRHEMEDRTWIQDLPPKLKRRVELAQEKNRLLEEDWKPPEPNPVLLELEPQVLRASSSQTGRVLFKDGAILGDREIEVSHWVQDQKQQEAQVDLHSGVYHFSSIEPTGKIRAEVRDPDGVLVASGEKYLSDKTKESKSGIWTLEVRPVQPSSMSRFKSLENEKKFLPISDSSQFHPSSLGFQQASVPGFRSFSYFDFGGLPIRVISERLWKAWAAALDLDLKTTSLHAGQVFHDHQALGDVEIEVPAPGRVIYLSSWIPDPRALQTDSQGFFLVLDLPQGRHEVIARRQGNFVARAWLQSLDGENSFIELHSRTQKIQTALHVYDAWSGAPQPASLDFGVYGVTTEVQALLPSASGLGILRVRPDNPEYLASWMSYREGQSELALPLSRRSWFESFMLAQKIPVEPTKRQFIGFVPRASYTPVLNSAFAYFDSQGRASPAPVKGGGFIAWNLDALDTEVQIEFSTGRRMARPLGESGLSSAIFSD